MKRYWHSSTEIILIGTLFVTEEERVYEAVPQWNRVEAEAALAWTSVDAVRMALLSISFNDSDWLYAQETCLRYVDDPELCLAAVIGLGHVAMVHRQIDYERVVPVLQRIRREGALAQGNAHSALSDIRHFVPESASLVGDLG